MRMKIHGGTACGEGNLCTTCSHSIITRGQKLDDEMVDCRVFGLGHRRVTFRVTSCSAYHDLTISQSPIQYSTISTS